MTITWLITRLLVYLLLWWVLTAGAADSWPVGIPAVLTAIYLEFRLFGPGHRTWTVGGTCRFILFFLKSSLLSGLDVVRRTYHPRRPLNPAMVEYPLGLQSSAARKLFIGTVSLLPGTLSTAVVQNNLVVHVLDAGRPVEQELKIIEDRVAAVFKASKITQ